MIVTVTRAETIIAVIKVSTIQIHEIALAGFTNGNSAVW